MKAKKVMNLQKALYIWRKRLNSTTTGTIDFDRIDSLNKIIYKLFEIFSIECKNDKLIIESGKRFMKHHIQILMNKFEKWNDKDYSYILNTFNKNLQLFDQVFSNYLVDNDFLFWAEQSFNMIKLLKCKNMEEFLNLVDNKSYTLCNRGIVKLNLLKEKIVKEIPFNKKEKIIGIYGIGQHTISLLKYYKEYIGDIKSNVIFIDSFKGFNNEVFQEQPIVNIKDVNKYNFDCIVISSFGSEEKMYRNLLNLLKQKVEIIKIYGDKYDFSLFV